MNRSLPTNSELWCGYWFLCVLTISSLCFRFLCSFYNKPSMYDLEKVLWFWLFSHFSYMRWDTLSSSTCIHTYMHTYIHTYILELALKKIILIKVFYTLQSVSNTCKCYILVNIFIMAYHSLFFIVPSFKINNPRLQDLR